VNTPSSIEKRFLHRGQLKYLLLLLAVLVVFPLLVTTPFPIHVGIMLLHASFLAISWNILGGFAGQFSLGHAAFFGIGAYVSLLLLIYNHIPIWIGMFLGAGAAVLLSIVIGFATFRLRGPYFALATLAVAEILKQIFIQFRDVTGGSVGVEFPRVGETPFIGWKAIGKPLTGDPSYWWYFESKVPYYYIALAMFLAAFALARKIEVSKIGLHLFAIRENELLTSTLGIPPLRWKLFAFILSAFLTGLGGAYYGLYFRYIDPFAVFGLERSIEPALSSIIGGLSASWGPILGSLILVPLALAMRAWLGGAAAGAHLFFLGLLMMVVILIAPEGISKYLKRAYSRTSLKP
jgi:branched-chain amino acid transport system permease protein